MSIHAYFEYQAKLTNAGHVEDEGQRVRCLIGLRMSIGMENSYTRLSYVNKREITSFL
jgi:hypothetical protein